MLYCHLLIHAEIYIHMLDTYRRNGKRRRKTSLTKYLPLTLFVRVQRVTQSLRVRGNWRPHITEIFWPQSYGRQRCVFLVLQGCSTQSGLPRTPSAGCGFPYHSSPPTGTRTQLSSTISFCSIRRPYIIFKLPRGGMDTPPRLRNFFWYLAIGMCHFLLSLEWPVWSLSSGYNCHAVQRSLSSGTSVYESIMGFFFTSSHFISQFPPMRFPLITAIRMRHLLPVHHPEWHFWPVQKVKT